MVKKDSEIISRKLDTIISILMNQTKIQEENLREKIIRLIKLGFENNEISDILGTSYSIVGKERSLLKKRSSNE